MKLKKKILPFFLILALFLLFSSIPVFASELTKAEVQQAVADQGQEAVTGNVFIWFLCAIAFLKVSQKIDSFMSSLGINVGNTGGNMMAELLIAGKSINNAMRRHGGSGGGYGKNGSPGSAAVGGSFLSGGLAGSVGRQMERSAVNAATGYSEGSGIGNSLYQSSLNKGGDFANNVVGSIAKGNYGQVGSIRGDDAAKAFQSYMGLNTENQSVSGYSDNSTQESSSYAAHQNVNEAFGNNGSPNQPANPIPSYTNMEIGGGKIIGTETTENGSRDFAMYHADQYMKPNQGEFDTVQSVDGAAWYKQYAQDTVSKTPYEKEDGKIGYHESIVQKLPPTPPRKDRV